MVSGYRILHINLNIHWFAEKFARLWFRSLAITSMKPPVDQRVVHFGAALSI